MEEPGNVVAATIRKAPRFDGTKPENYRDWRLKTRLVLSLSNQDVFHVLNGWIEPTPAFTNTDTPNAGERACNNIFSVLYLVTSGPAATLAYKFGRRSGKRTEGVERFAIQVQHQQEGAAGLRR